MKCKYQNHDIALLVEDDLPESERRGIDRHLYECAECRALAAELRQSQALFKVLRQEAASAGALEQVRSRVLAEISGLRSSTAWGRRVERWLWLGLRRGYALAGAGLFAAVFLSIWYFDRTAQKSLEVRDTQALSRLRSAERPLSVSEAPAKPRQAARAARRKAPAAVAEPVSHPARKEPAQLVVKLLTDDPNIVIYWLVDQNGD